MGITFFRHRMCKLQTLDNVWKALSEECYFYLSYNFFFNIKRKQKKLELRAELDAQRKRDEEQKHERLRQEAEEKSRRLDPVNWPLYVYVYNVYSLYVV